MWTATVVMGHELAHDPSQMLFVDRNQEVEALATNRSDQPFTERVGMHNQLHPMST